MTGLHLHISNLLPMKNADLLEWLRGKITDAEKAVRAREQAVSTFRSGTDESWAAAAEFHPLTSGRPMSKKQRAEAAASNERIAVKCRLEVEMFNAVYAALSK